MEGGGSQTCCWHRDPGLRDSLASETPDISQAFPDGLESASFPSQSCVFVVHINVRSGWAGSPKEVTIYQKVIDLKKLK